MNILFVHEIDWLKTVVFEIHSLAELLARRGHRVYAIDYEDKWKRNGHGLGSLKTCTLDNVARASPNARVTLKRPGFIRVPALSRLSAFVTHYRELERTLRQEKIDVIILYSVPTNGLQTLWLARRQGVPVVFRSIDILHQLVPYPVLRPPTYFLESQVYRNVDVVLTLSPNLSDYIVHMGAPRDRVRVLPLGVDTDLFKPLSDCAQLGGTWGIAPEDKVLLFMGTLFDFSGLDLVVRQMPRLLEAEPKARLLIVGDGPQRAALESDVARLGLGRAVTITGFQPYDKMPTFINLATICINPFRLTAATRDIVPSKILQYLACGKAVVATPLPGTVTMLPGRSCGVEYCGSSEDLVAKAVSLLQEPHRRQELEKAGLEYMRRTHSYDRIAEDLESVLALSVRRTRRGLAGVA